MDITQKNKIVYEKIDGYLKKKGVSQELIDGILADSRIIRLIRQCRLNLIVTKDKVGFERKLYQTHIKQPYKEIVTKITIIKGDIKLGLLDDYNLKMKTPKYDETKENCVFIEEIEIYKGKESSRKYQLIIYIS